MHDLWPKVVEERKNWNPLELCSRQRWKTTQANHIRKYKRYLDDHSVPVPKSTKLDRDKRSATRSNTASHLDSSVGLSTKLAVVLTELIASHNGETFARETEATICHYNGAFKDISCQEQVFSLRVFHNIRFSSHFFVTFESIRIFQSLKYDEIPHFNPLSPTGNLDRISLYIISMI